MNLPDDWKLWLASAIILTAALGWIVFCFVVAIHFVSKL